MRNSLNLGKLKQRVLMKKLSKDKKVAFYEDSHSYFLGKKRLESITKYISRFKPFFDKEKISKAYAKKHGLKQEEVLADWDRKAKESCAMGTYIHSIFENYILGRTIETNNYPKCEIALQIISDLFVSNRLKPIETEYIVYNNKYAGQVDCIAVNENKEYFILDWKTNSEIKKSNGWQDMTGEYDYLEDCNYNHYSIQLRAYQKMCKEYKIKDCYIVHLKDDSYELIKCKDIKVNV